MNGADFTAANTVAAAQWTVETKKVGTVTHYAFKNIEGEQYLAFEKKDGAYALAAKKEANDETKSFRWFTVAANGNLQAVLSDEKEPYFLGLKNFRYQEEGSSLRNLQRPNYSRSFCEQVWRKLHNRVPGNIG